MAKRTPAQTARSAMAAVQAGDRDAWLELFAADALVEDPVGHLPPIAGREGLREFWQNARAGMSSVSFEVTREWEAGEAEAMLLASVSVSPDGETEISYDGAFNYVLNDSGRIASLRAFWDLPAVVAELSG